MKADTKATHTKHAQTGCPQCGAEFRFQPVGTLCPKCHNAVLEDESCYDTKAAHTPGPWTIQEFFRAKYGQDDVKTFCIRHDETNVCIAEVGHVDDYFAERNEANARLIAASPDLLARLRECVDYLYAEADNAEDRSNGLIAECEAAIAKAEGRE